MLVTYGTVRVSEIVAIGQSVGDGAGDDQQDAGLGVGQVDDAGRCGGADERNRQSLDQHRAIREIRGEDQPGRWSARQEDDGTGFPDEVDRMRGQVADAGERRLAVGHDLERIPRKRRAVRP